MLETLHEKESLKEKKKTLKRCYSLSLMLVGFQPLYQEITDKKDNDAKYTIYFATSYHQLCWAQWRQKGSIYVYDIPLLPRPLSNQPWCTAPHDSTTVRPSHSFNRPLILPIYYFMSVAPVREFFFSPSFCACSIVEGSLTKKRKKALILD